MREYSFIYTYEFRNSRRPTRPLVYPRRSYRFVRPITLIITQVIYLLLRSVTDRRSKVEKLLQQHPSLELRIRPVLDYQVH